MSTLPTLCFTRNSNESKMAVESALFFCATDDFQILIRSEPQTATGSISIDTSLNCVQNKLPLFRKMKKKLI